MFFGLGAISDAVKVALINMTLIRSVRSSSRLYQHSRVLLDINKYTVCQSMFGQFARKRIYTGGNLTERKLIC